ELVRRRRPGVDVHETVAPVIAERGENGAHSRGTLGVSGSRIVVLIPPIQNEARTHGSQHTTVNRACTGATSFAERQLTPHPSGRSVPLRCSASACPS